jgi:predicted nucleic acid-binding protein
MHRFLDPRKCNIAVDANVLNRNGNDEFADRLKGLIKSREIHIVLAGGVRREIKHPHAPQAKKDVLLSQIFNLRPELTASQKSKRDAVRLCLQGNAKPGKHDADASHLSEAAETNCSYFITNDQRMLRKRNDLSRLVPVSIVNPEELLKIFEDNESGDAAAQLPPPPVEVHQMTNAERSAREYEMRNAVDAVQASISFFEKEKREPDFWEKDCLVEAICAIGRGNYYYAVNEVYLMFIPQSEREMKTELDNKIEKFNLSRLRKALEAVAAEPVRRFPHFGPIIFAGDC